MDTLLRAETRAALQALEAAPPGHSDPPDLLLTPLARLGDALRLSLEIPRPLLRWLAAAGTSTLSDAASALRSEVATWSLPSPATGWDDDPELAFVVRRRDEAESVEKALLRACLAMRVAPVSLAGAQELRAALTVFDAGLRPVASRSQVEAMLGVRCALLSPQSWTSTLEERDVAATTADEEAPAWDLAATELPPPVVLEHYVYQGSQTRSVEGLAERDVEFAAHLAALIDAAREQDPVLSLRAQRWRRTYGRTAGAAPAPVVLAAVPRQQLAAATQDERPASRTDWSLGQLTPVAAEARLLCTATTATLRVYSLPGAVARVEFGDDAATAPDEAGVWSVAIPVTDRVLPLRVVAATGEEFAVEVELSSSE